MSVTAGAVVADLDLTDRPPDDWRRQYMFTPDGGQLAYSDWAADRSIVRLFDLRSLRPAGVVAGAETPLAFTADGRAFAYRAAGECRVVDWPGGAIRGRVPDDRTSRYELSPAGDRLFRFRDDPFEHLVGCWDVATGRCIWEATASPETGLPGDRRWLFDQRCAVDVQVPEVTAMDTTTGEVHGRLRLTGDEWVVNWHQSCSPSGPVVAVGSLAPEGVIGAWLEKRAPWLGIKPGRVRLVDVTTGRTTCDIPGGAGEPCFTPAGDGLLVRAGSTLTLWDVPPRVPWTWRAIAAVVFALPLGWLLWRRPAAKC